MRYVQLLCRETTSFHVPRYSSWADESKVVSSIIRNEITLKPVKPNADEVLFKYTAKLEKNSIRSGVYDVIVATLSDTKFRLRLLPQYANKVFICSFRNNALVVCSSYFEDYIPNATHIEGSAQELLLKNVRFTELSPLQYAEVKGSILTEIETFLSQNESLAARAHAQLEPWYEYLDWTKKRIAKNNFELYGKVKAITPKRITIKFNEITKKQRTYMMKLSPKILVGVDSRSRDYADVEYDFDRTDKISDKNTIVFIHDNVAAKVNEEFCMRFEDVGSKIQCERLEKSIRDLDACEKPKVIKVASWLFNIKNTRAKAELCKDIVFSPGRQLNDEQKAAVKQILNTEDVSFILGPPGTGKTTVIAEAITQITKQGKTVLLSSQSNDAIDNALGRLDNTLDVRAIRMARNISADNPYSIENMALNLSRKLAETLRTGMGKSKNWISNQAYFFEKYDTFSDTEKQLADIAVKCYQKYPKNQDEYNAIYREYKAGFEGNREFVRVAPYIFTGHASDKQILRYIILQENWNESFKYIVQKLATWTEKGSSTTEIKQEMKRQKALMTCFGNIEKILQSNMCTEAEDIEIFNKGYNEELQDRLIKTSNVYGITCNSNFDKLLNKFLDSSNIECDYAIIDEVSKATLPEILSCLLRVKHVILVGDHHQLPPVFMADDDEVEEAPDLVYKFRELITNTVFKQLYNSAPAHAKCMLKKQYRMHNEIANIVTTQFYRDQHQQPLLENGLDDTISDTAKNHGLTVMLGQKKLIVPEHHLYWIDTTPKAGSSKEFYEQQAGTSKYNNCEINVIEKVLELIDSTAEKHFNVGVISFYAAQNKKMRQTIGKAPFENLKVDVDTVDKFQGQERDIIIISMVRSLPRRRITSNNSFFKAFERLNVAFSRAQKLLIVVASAAFCERQNVSIPAMSSDDASIDDITTVSERFIYRDIIEAIKKNGGFIGMGDIL